MKLYKHSVFFSNPYKSPPNGWPPCLWWEESDSHRPSEKAQRKIKAILKRLYALNIFSYYQGFSCESLEPRRVWSDEAKFRNRLKRLRRRQEKRYSLPLLLESAIEAEISKKPEYFGVK